jgi:hypothetical protein
VSNLVWFLVALLCAYGYCAAVQLCLRNRGRRGIIASTIVATVVLFTPLIIPANRVITRALVCVACGELFFKMIDYARQSRLGIAFGGDRGAYFRFLIPFPAFCVIFGARDRPLRHKISRQRELLRVVIGAAIAAGCRSLVTSRIVGFGSSSVLQYLLEIMLFVGAVESLSQALFGLERLAGFETTPLMRFFLVSTSVAEFWRRYNTRVSSWMNQNIYLPSGGRRKPTRGVVATFFVSAIFHELAFGIATSRFDGRQFAFFMLQAPAVLISSRVERFARRPALSRTILARWSIPQRTFTILWMLTTSILFFHGVNRIFPSLFPYFDGVAP